MEQFSRYESLVLQEAARALELARQAAQAGGSRSGLAEALPAARVLLGRPVQREEVQPLLAGLTQWARLAGEAGAEPPRLATLTGQSRPVYFPLAVHLFLRAVEVIGSQLTPADRDAAQQAARGLGRAMVAALESPQDPQQLALTLWQALVATEAAVLAGDSTPGAALAAVERIVQASSTGPLHTMDPDDLLDAWTYHELAGLHALDRLAQRTGRADWRGCVEQAAHYHLEHTQPDYTTYEPWAVHVFLRWPQTAMFADQQLHDVATNLGLSGPQAALMPALLLADAADALRRAR